MTQVLRNLAENLWFSGGITATILVAAVLVGLES